VLEANKDALPRRAEDEPGGVQPRGRASTQRLMIESGRRRHRAQSRTRPDRRACKDKPGIKVETYPQAALHFFSFNLKHDKLKNPAIWEAAKYLIDYEGIANSSCAAR
jgi:peptide/nickel transport system substrate-binding protein